MDATTVRTLTEPAGRAVVELLGDAATEGSLVSGERLRRDHDPALVAAAMTLVELRRTAVGKFDAADAARLVTDRSGLEQATRARVAAHRAARLAAAGRTAVDLGCGIGADLIAMSRAGLHVTGVDRDPARVAMTRANLDALGLAGAVIEGDAGSIDLAAFDLAFVDPARRDGSRRRFDPAAYSPPWLWVEGLLEHKPTSAAKVAPGFPHELVPPAVEAELVSDGGDLVEMTLWGRGLAAARRRATVLPSGDSLTDADEPEVVPLGEVGAWFYEPDDAVIRAGLVGAAAVRLAGHLVDGRIAYVSSDEQVVTRFARAYRVLEEVPYRERPLRQVLRARGVGRLTIKKRGVAVVPEQLRARLALRGDAAATLLLTRVAGKARAFLVEPVSNPPG